MRNKNKFILSLFLSFLLIFSNLVFVYAEDEIIDDTQQIETEEEVKVEEQKQEEPQNKEEIKEEPQDKEETAQKTQEDIVNEPQTETEEENNNKEENIKENNRQIKSLLKNNNTTSNEIEVETEDELLNAVATLKDKETKTVKLKNNITVSNSKYLTVDKGTLTILGENNTLTSCIAVAGTAILNLGIEGYEKTLQVLSNRTDSSVIYTKENSELNIYNGVTIGPCTVVGMAGGISGYNQSTINMKGGTITDCHSYSVSGGIYLDENATLNMSGGTIDNCSGYQGGAVGLSGGSPLGPNMIGRTTFNMTGGTIQNCTDLWVGGGAICAYTRNPVAINIKGGTIQNCSASSSRYGYGGAMLVYSTDPNTKIDLKSGIITNNSAKYGGGLFIFNGSTIIADRFGLYNNIAIYGGDDIYNNGTNVTLGAACATAVLTACNHLIDGWYDDGINTRWSYTDCTGEEQHIAEFTELGVIVAREYGLKAAHGLNPKEPTDDPVEPDEPITPNEPITSVEPQDSTEPTTPTDTTPTKINPTTAKTVTKVSAIDTSTITDNTTPVPKQPKTATISEPKTPKTESTVYWALVNLILSILAVILGFIFVIQKEENKHINKRKLIAAGVALISVIIFVFTEDMNLPMTYTDKWTFPMILPLIIEIINLVIKRNKSEGEDYNG